jgi:hypothetical protein
MLRGTGRTSIETNEHLIERFRHSIYRNASIRETHQLESLTHAILALSAALDCDYCEAAESGNAGRYQADGAP